MDLATLIGSLIVTVIGGIIVLLIQKRLENKHDSTHISSTKPKNEDDTESKLGGAEISKTETRKKGSTLVTKVSAHPEVVVSNIEGLQMKDLPDYIWSDEKTIICRVGDKDYFLQGLNAHLFAEVAYSPIFLDQLPQDPSQLKLAVSNLAIALATIDRQYSEPASIYVIRSLWLKEKQTGIKKFIDLLSQRQWKNSEWDGYRDHLNHMLKVYLTGIYLFKSCQKLKDVLLTSSDCNEHEFLRQWLYASTFHDIGYIFELVEPGKGIENLKFIQDYVQDFLYYHDQELSENLTAVGLKPQTIDRKHAREILSLINIRFREIQSVEDLGIPWGKEFNLWDRLDNLCKGTGVGEHGISGYLRLCLTQTPPMLNGREPFYDHGITGAITLLYIGYNQKSIFEGLAKGLLGNSAGEPSILEGTGRQSVLEKMVEWAGNQDKNIGVIEKSATAIALHNIYKDAWKPEEIPWQVDLSNFWIGIDDYPLAFFLILVDILQGWDRPGFNPTKTAAYRYLQGSDILMEANAEKIFLGYSNNADEYSRTLSDLKTILKPDDIDKFFAPWDYTSTRDAFFLSSPKLRKYADQLIKKVRGEWFDRFIDLHMEIPIKLGTEQDKHKRQYTISQIAIEFQREPIAILGEPGAGKTTLVKKLIVDFANNGPRIPVFIEMGKYLGEKSFEDFINLDLDGTVLVNWLKRGTFLIVFDGLNESVEYLDDATKAIMRFIEKYPLNQYILTCRIPEYHPILRKAFREFLVLRVSPEAAEKYLIAALGESKGQELYNRLPTKIKNLCQNPLLLFMLTYLFSSGDSDIQMPSSKAILYKMFLLELYKREDSLRSMYTRPSLREEFLGHLSFRLENKSTVFNRGNADFWISELYRDEYQNSGVNIIRLIKETTELPPMKALDIGRGIEDRISFMHQSFQEYYAAYYLDILTKKGKLTIQQLTEYLSPSNEHWWETLSLFAGLQDDATLTIHTLKKKAGSVAEAQEDQRPLAFVARCIREAKFVKPQEVDDVIIRTLLTFKFGKVPFDYNLIYGLKLIEPEQRSSIFPARLIEDVNWWLDKYARVQPAKLDNETTTEDLLDYIRKGDDSLAYDALFTLRYHPSRGTTIFELLRLLDKSLGNLREQIIITLGYLESNALPAVDILIDIIKSPKETKWARAYGLNALGRIGDQKAVQPMIDYMQNHNNPYRDSASWSLQGLAKRNKTDVGLIEKLRQVFIDALLSETSDLEGRYAKGNIVYTLGELNAIKYINEITDWLVREKDPYVIEDGVQAVGQLRQSSSLPVVIKYLQHSDPVVRMMSIEAMVKIILEAKANSDYNLIKSLLTDPFEIVRESAQNSLNTLSEKLGMAL